MNPPFEYPNRWMRFTSNDDRVIPWLVYKFWTMPSACVSIAEMNAVSFGSRGCAPGQTFHPRIGRERRSWPTPLPYGLLDASRP